MNTEDNDTKQFIQELLDRQKTVYLNNLITTRYPQFKHNSEVLFNIPNNNYVFLRYLKRSPLRSVKIFEGTALQVHSFINKYFTERISKNMY